jgi:hypothetical protein
MRRARRSQRDLFDEAAQMTEVWPELRTKLTPLLQALLAEAAGVGGSCHCQSNDRGGEEVRDDPDHG